MNSKWAEMVNKKTENGFLILDYKRENDRTYVYVQCPICNSKTWKRADTLRQIVSCGCYNEEKNYKKPLKLKTGQRYNMLTIICRTNKKYLKEYLWLCKCDCGNEVEVLASVLKRGSKYSCGCETYNNVVRALKENAKNNEHKYFIKNTNIELITRDKLLSTNTSGVTGVRWKKDKNKWMADIIFQKKHYFLGYFDDKMLAIKARKLAEKYLREDFVDWYKHEYSDEWKKLENKRKKRR